MTTTAGDLQLQIPATRDKAGRIARWSAQLPPEMSLSPAPHGWKCMKPPECGGFRVARDRIELSTFRFSGGRSYQLSYLAGNAGKEPNDLATLTGLEPATFAVTGRRANQLRHRALRTTGGTYSQRDSNPRCRLERAES